MLSTELFESYEIIGDELYELIENLDNNTDNLDVQAYYRVAERLYNDDEICPINCDKETKLFKKWCEMKNNLYPEDEFLLNHSYHVIIKLGY